ncbi:surface antigen [Streptomyces sp. 846.5]|nr:CHAP domain-containing protein [Streptomyces sp. 846.5]TDU06623.1 surface antigen [Streptomyces sp. 846.5]
MTATPAMAAIGTNDYPFASYNGPGTNSAGSYWTDSNGKGTSTYGYNYRNCTDFVAWRLHNDNGFNLPGGIGNGADWGNWAQQPGHTYTVNTTAAAGAVAWWPANSKDQGVSTEAWGHVAYVSSVNTSGSVNIEEYNHVVKGGGFDGAYHTRTITASSTEQVQYIHFKDLSGGGSPPPAGPKLLTVSSLHTSDGYIHVFAGNATGSIWEIYYGNGTSPTPDLLGTPDQSAVTSVSSMQTPDGIIHVFDGDAGGKVWETYYGNGISPTQDLLSTPNGTQPITSISSMLTPDGFIHVFSATLDGKVYETKFGNGGGPVTNLMVDLSGPGGPVNGISSLYDSAGYIHVFSGNRGGSLWETYEPGTGTPNPKSDLLGTPTGWPVTSVSSLQTPDGYVHVIASMTSGDVGDLYYAGGVSPRWLPLTNLVKVDSVTSMLTSDGYIHVYSGIQSGSAWETYYKSGVSPQSDLLGTPDGSTVMGVSAMTTTDGYTHIFSVTSNGYAYETYFGNGNGPKTTLLANLS